MSFVPEELVTLFRGEVDDTVAPYLWSDDEVYFYLDLAQKKFARLTRIFQDGSTAAVTQVAVTAAEPFVDLDPRVLEVRRAKLSDGSVVEVRNLNEMDEVYGELDYGVPMSPRWETSTGTPRYMVMDIEEGRGRLAPIPVANDTLSLYVERLPLLDITVDSVSLEVRDSEDQYALLSWMKKLAYNKTDSQTYNPQLSTEAALEFTHYCSERKAELGNKRRRAGVVRYGGP